MPQVTGIDHICLAVADLARSQAFYDTVLRDVPGFEKGKPFVLGGEAHLNYYNHLFGFVLRPARSASPHDPYAPGMHHFCLRVVAAAGFARRASLRPVALALWCADRLAAQLKSELIRPDRAEAPHTLS